MSNYCSSAPAIDAGALVYPKFRATAKGAMDSLYAQMRCAAALTSRSKTPPPHKEGGQIHRLEAFTTGPSSRCEHSAYILGLSTTLQTLQTDRGRYDQANLAPSIVLLLRTKFSTVALTDSSSSNMFLKIFENFKGLF